MQRWPMMVEVAAVSSSPATHVFPASLKPGWVLRFPAMTAFSGGPEGGGKCLGGGEGFW